MSKIQHLMLFICYNYKKTTGDQTLKNVRDWKRSHGLSTRRERSGSQISLNY